MEQEKHSIMYKKSRANGSQSGGLPDCSEVTLIIQIIIIFSSTISFWYLDVLQDLPSQELLELPSSHEKVTFFIHLAKLLQTQLFCIICKIGSLWHSAVWKWDFPVHQQQSLFVACNFDKDQMTIDLNGNASKDSKHRAQVFCKLWQNGL